MKQHIAKNLTRTSHTQSNTMEDMPVPTASNSISHPHCSSGYTSGVFTRFPCIHQHLHHFVTKGCEKSWLTPAVTIIATVIFLMSCATSTPHWGSTETGLILKYLMEDGDALRYHNSFNFDQTIEIRGREVEIQLGGFTGFSLVKEGMSEGNHRLEITLDSMEIFVNTPRGRMAPDMSEVEGRHFELVLSRLGEEVSLKGDKEIRYETSPGKSRSATAFFQSMFPDLPDHPVRIGDTWKSTNTIRDESEDSDLVMTFENLHHLDGFEKVLGYECARVRTTFDGTMKGKSREGDMDLVIDADISGSETWFFAYREGRFIKAVSEGSSTGTITGSGEKTIRIPASRTFKIETVVNL